MGKIISFLNQKGGVGKTTIATNLAHAFLIEKNKVLLVDADPQGSTRNWQEVNGGMGIPVIGMDRHTQFKDIEKITESYEFTIVDGAPSIMDLCSAIVKISDLIIIPVQPSPYDVWACLDLVEVIKARRMVSDLPLAFFMISRAIKKSKLSREIQHALNEYGFPVLDSSTTQRIIYPTAAVAGKTVFGLKDMQAELEIKNLMNEIKEKINDATGKKK